MTFTPCEHCPGPGACDEVEAFRRALRGACTATVRVEWRDPEPGEADALEERAASLRGWRS